MAERRAGKVEDVDKEERFIKSSDFKRIYVSAFAVMWTKTDFRIAVIDNTLSTPPNIEVNAEIVLSPVAMKNLTSALMDRLEEYEKLNGEIEPPKISEDEEEEKEK